jgi:hypothetical protein
MKRPSQTPTRAKRRKISDEREPHGPTAPDSRIEGSLYEEASPYLITTARIPIDALGPGSNRPIDERHVKRLLKIFLGQTPDRESAEHYIRGKCRKADVDRMLQHIGASTGLNSARYARFDNWNEVSERKIELFAGQHRLSALEEYVRQKKLPRGELWWICEIYDESLPPEIEVKLAANRSSATLPDSHGQIWTAAALLAKSNPSFFKGSSLEVEEEIAQRLKLDGRVPFPASRMVTLLRNTKWNDMITRWCKTSLGEATFNISTWDEMARCRIDEVRVRKINSRQGG